MTQQTRCVMYKTDTPSDDLLGLLEKWPNRATYTDCYVFVTRPPDCTDFLDLQELPIEELQAMFELNEQPSSCIYITDEQGRAIYKANYINEEGI